MNALSTPPPPDEAPRASASDDVVAAELVGYRPTKIDGYDIQEVVGRGGMGVVYRARHQTLGRTVAIKMIRSAEFADKQELDHFRYEAEIVANLQHPNIVQLYQVGEQSGLPYLAFEFVEGGSLSQRIAGKPQPPLASAKLVETLARAVHVAHTRGVVHRDLKPANVLLAADGTPKIADFGLARQFDKVMHSRSDVIVGTACYMSPEQAWGDSKTHVVGPATDVYSLGAILYEMLTGEPPFKAESSRQTLEQVWSKEPAPPRQKSPGIPRDLEVICLRCLQKEPARRYPSAEALAEDLRRFQNKLPITARPVGIGERTWLWARRNPLVAGLIAAIVLVGVTGFSGTVKYAVDAKTAEGAAKNLAIEKGLLATKEAKSATDAKLSAAEAKRNEIVAERQTEEAKRQKSVAEELYRTVAIAYADAEIHGGRYAKASAQLDKTPPEHRHFEWNLLRRKAAGADRGVFASNHGFQTLAAAPDGSTFATSGPWIPYYKTYEPVRVWDAKTMQMKAELGDGATSLYLGPGGKQVVATWGLSTGIWDVAGNRLTDSFSGLFSMAMSPDATQLALGENKVVSLFDIHQPKPAAGTPIDRPPADLLEELRNFKNRKPTRSLEGATYDIFSLDYSGDGERLIAVNFNGKTFPGTAQPIEERGDLLAWDLATGKLESRIACPHKSSWNFVATNRDGSRACVAVREMSSFDSIELYDLRDGKRVQEIKLPFYSATAIALSPDGQRLVAGNYAGEIAILDADSGQVTETLRSDHANIDQLSYLSNDELISADGKGLVKIWDLRRPLGGVGLLANERIYALSPDGNTIATSGAHGQIKVWDLATLRAVQTLPSIPIPNADPPANYQIIDLAYGPDGRIVTLHSDQVVRAWNPKQETMVQLFSPPAKGKLQPDEREPVGGGSPTYHEDQRQIWFTNMLATRASFTQFTYRLSRDGKFLARLKDWSIWHEAPKRDKPLFNLDLSYSENLQRLDVWNLATKEPVIGVTMDGGLVAGGGLLGDTFRFETDSKSVRIERRQPIYDAGEITIAWELPSGKPLPLEKKIHPPKARLHPRGGRQLEVIDAYDERDDGRLLLKDAAGNLELSLGATGEKYRDAAFTPDGNRVIAVREKGGIDIFDGSPFTVPAKAPPSRQEKDKRN